MTTKLLPPPHWLSQRVRPANRRSGTGLRAAVLVKLLSDWVIPVGQIHVHDRCALTRVGGSDEGMWDSSCIQRAGVPVFKEIEITGGGKKGWRDDDITIITIDCVSLCACPPRPSTLIVCLLASHRANWFLKTRKHLPPHLPFYILPACAHFSSKWFVICAQIFLPLL